jgi:hypothetical protein
VVSKTNPLAAGCGSMVNGTLYHNAEVQPMVAGDPHDPQHLIAVYQQDRWSKMGSNGLLTAVSNDFGVTWTAATPPPFSLCTGGTAQNGGDFAVSTDSWASIGPNGTALQVTMAINPAGGPETAMLVSRSTDGGHTWSPAKTITREGSAYFNDRPTVTTDPGRPGTAYVVWDRITDTSTSTEEHYFQPTYISITKDDGLTWSAPRAIYDPGLNKGTIGNQLVVLRDGTLVIIFDRVEQDMPTELDSVAVIRSTDGGQTWSDAVTIDQVHGNGNFTAVADPDGGMMSLRDAALPLVAVGPDGRTLHAVWHDHRFRSTATADIDDVAYSTSADAGATWSPAVQVNHSPDGVSAMIPVVAVTSDGTVGVTYYDFRHNDAMPTLPTDSWLVTCKADCSQSSSWRETHLAGPFDSRSAPMTSQGLMLGDYTGLATNGKRFVSLQAEGTGDAMNPTDVHSVIVTVP